MLPTNHDRADHPEKRKAADQFRQIPGHKGLMAKPRVSVSALALVLCACTGETGSIGELPSGSGGRAVAGGVSGNPGLGTGATQIGQIGASGGAPQAGAAPGGTSTGGNSHTASGTGGSSTGAASGVTGGAGSAGSPSTASGGSPPTSGGSPPTSGGSHSTTSGGAASFGGSAAGGPSTGGATGGTPAFRLPTANAPFDYQIGGAYDPPQGVKVVSRDRESKPASGLYNICYVNGFQAQPGEAPSWEKDHPELILRDSGGQPVIDENWNEMLLDTSTAAKRSALGEIVGSWIRGCAASGFDAVEIDNLDSYSRSGGLLSEANNLAFMKLLSAAAHGSGLAIAQKNSAELVNQAKQMGTDFAVVEECNRWDECGDYQTAYGNLLFIIEYREQDLKKGCSDHPELSIVLRDLDVTTPGSGSYVYDGC